MTKESLKVLKTIQKEDLFEFGLKFLSVRFKHKILELDMHEFVDNLDLLEVLTDLWDETGFCEDDDPIVDTYNKLLEAYKKRVHGV